MDEMYFKGLWYRYFYLQRTAATSVARNKSVSVMDIMKVADWSNSNTFTKFYYKPIESSEFGQITWESASDDIEDGGTRNNWKLYRGTYL